MATTFEERQAELDALDAPTFQSRQAELDALEGKEAPSGTLTNILSSANSRIAKLLGLPYDAVNEALTLAGVEGLESGEFSKAITRAYKKLGFIKPGMDEESISGKIGAMIPDSILMLYGMTGAGNTLASRGPGMLRDLGRTLVDRPVTSAVATVGGVPGMVVGGEKGKDWGRTAGENLAGGPGATGKFGEVLGETIGAVGGGLITGGAATIAASTRVPFTGRLSKRATGSDENLAFIPKHERVPGLADQDPIINPNARTGYPRAFAEEQIAREKEAIDRAILREIHGVEPKALSNAVASDRFRTSLETVEKKADAMVDTFWARTDRTRRVPTQPLEDLATEGLAASDAAPSMFPREIYQRILQLGESYAGEIPISKLVGADSLRSEVLQAAREAGGSAAGRAPNSALQRKLYDLAETILNTIETTYPKDIAIKQAREISRAYHDRFTRGPLADILAHNYNNVPRVLPEETMDALIRHLRGVGAVQTAATRLHPNAPRTPFPIASAEGALAAGQEEAVMVNRMEEAIRAQYVNAAKEAGEAAAVTNPEGRARAEAIGGAKWLRTTKEKIERLTHTTRRLQEVSDESVELMQQRDRLTTGALQQYTQRNPTNSARAILDANKPHEEVAQLVNNPSTGFRADPEAMEGWQRSLVNTFLEGSNSFVQLRTQMTEAKLARAFEISFENDPAKLERLKRLVNSGAEMEVSGPRGMEAASRWTANLLSHLVGLHIGRAVAQTFNTGSAGTLALPAKFGRIAMEASANMMQKVATTKMMTEAVMDPQMEARLLRRLPSNVSDLEREIIHGRRYLLKAEALADRLGTHVIQGGRSTLDLLRAEEEEPRSP